MTRRVTIKDVAKAANISETTVSLILNNKGSRFSVETIERVRKAQSELHYVPNINAQSLTHQHSKMIGVLIPDFRNPFFNQFVSGIQEKAEELEYIPLIFGFNNDRKRGSYYLEELVGRAVDGLIIASDELNEADVDHVLKANQVPYIVLDRNTTSEGERLGIDDFNGGQIVAKFLYESGHRDVVVVMPKTPSANIHNRWLGFKSYAETIEKMTVSQIFAPLTKVGGRLAASELQSIPKVTGIFAINDEVALGLYRGINDQGKRIPEDYSIVGFDDIEIDQYLTPTLTTVHQPILELGRLATKLLIQQIDQPQKQIQKVKLPVELVVRNSTIKR